MKSLYAALAGLILVFSLVVGCNSSSESTDKKSSTRPRTGADANQDSGSSGNGIANAILDQTNVDSPKVDDDDLPEDLNQLMLALARKETEQTRAQDEKEFFAIQQFRAAASRKLLGMKINQEQRIGFIKIQLDSLLKLISLGDPQAELDFQKLISDHAADKQPRVREAVAVAGLIHDLRERVANRNPDMQPVLAAATKIASEFPDSFDVCKELGEIASQMMQQGDREAAKRMAWTLINTYQDSANERARNYVKRLESQIRVASSNLDLIMKEIRDKRPEALERYREAIQYLLGGDVAGDESVEPVVSSLIWLERSGMVLETLEANRIVAVASMDIKNEALRNRLQDNCGLRQARLSLVGQPFSITGLTATGERFGWSAFRGERPVVVVFWTPREPSSVRLVRQLAELPQFQEESGVKLLAASITSDANTSNLFPNAPANMALIGGNPSAAEGPSEFISLYGVEQTPQVVLVDRGGQVLAVNPLPNTLQARISELETTQR